MKSLFIALFTIFAVSFCQAEVIVISGVYQGKDLYVKNPETSSGVGFCIFEVQVNSKVTSDEVNSPAFAVDLKVWGLAIGTPIEIVLRCKEKCDVKIINPEVVYPNSTFEIGLMSVNPEGVLSWTTSRETAPIAYVVEQFKWNRWIKIGEVQGTGKTDKNEYTFQTKLHSGNNTFRVYQMDHKGQRTSQEVKVESKVAPISIVGNKMGNTLEFSEETDYEIYSEYGSLVKAGRGKSVDTSKFFKGKYYVSFDNKGGMIIDKK